MNISDLINGVTAEVKPLTKSQIDCASVYRADDGHVYMTIKGNTDECRHTARMDLMGMDGDPETYKGRKYYEALEKVVNSALSHHHVEKKRVATCVIQRYRDADDTVMNVVHAGHLFSTDEQLMRALVFIGQRFTEISEASAVLNVPPFHIMQFIQRMPSSVLMMIDAKKRSG